MTGVKDIRLQFQRGTIRGSFLQKYWMDFNEISYGGFLENVLWKILLKKLVNGRRKWGRHPYYKYNTGSKTGSKKRANFFTVWRLTPISIKLNTIELQFVLYLEIFLKLKSLNEKYENLSFKKKFRFFWVEVTWLFTLSLRVKIGTTEIPHSNSSARVSFSKKQIFTYFGLVS